MTVKTERAHGTRAKYNREGCRCQDCREANHQQRDHRARQIAYGRWQPYIDAEPARRHAQALLAAGVPRRTLAALPGVSRGSLDALLYGRPAQGKAPSKTIRPDHARAILAIPLARLPEGGRTKTDATGTRRRIQALIAAGWPVAQLARLIGAKPSNFRVTITGPSPYVTHSTAVAVRSLYRQLCGRDPLTSGVQRRYVNEARAWARRQNWAPVGAWADDEIDDPNATPNRSRRLGTPRNAA